MAACDIWTAYLGDVEFAITAPVDWAAAQRHYLAHYLPGRLGDHALRTFRLDIRVDAAACRELAERTVRAPLRRLETVPGVVLVESHNHKEHCFAVVADHLEHQHSAWADHRHRPAPTGLGHRDPATPTSEHSGRALGCGVTTDLAPHDPRPTDTDRAGRW